jgi:hypothetical protein
LDVCHDEFWWDYNLIRFRDQQWMFSSPLFNQNSFKKDLVEGCRLPFTSKGSHESDGHFGNVREVSLRMDHQNVVDKVRAELDIHKSLFNMY